MTITAHGDITHFQYHARQYVRGKGRHGPDLEDIVSAMVVDVLEHPQKRLSMDYLYLHALDLLNPRLQEAGVRTRTSRRTLSLDQPIPQGVNGSGRVVWQTVPAVQATPLVELPNDIPAQGRIRAILLLHGLYGLTLAEIGVVFGLTAGRISQLLTAWRQGLGPPPPAPGWLTVEEDAWMRL